MMTNKLPVRWRHQLQKTQERVESSAACPVVTERLTVHEPTEHLSDLSTNSIDQSINHAAGYVPYVSLKE